MKQYVNVKMCIIRLDTSDVIQTSGNGYDVTKDDIIWEGNW